MQLENPKSFIHPIYQYGILVYSTADKKVMEKIENQQKLLIRIIFTKGKFESKLTLRSKYKIPPLEKELHVYELLKLLATVLGQTHAHPDVNSYIRPKEIHTLSEPKKRNKLLKTEIRLSKQNKKPIKVRVRILCNILVKYDISVLKIFYYLTKTIRLLFA